MVRVDPQSCVRLLDSSRRRGASRIHLRTKHYRCNYFYKVLFNQFDAPVWKRIIPTIPNITASTYRYNYLRSDCHHRAYHRRRRRRFQNFRTRRSGDCSRDFRRDRLCDSHRRVAAAPFAERHLNQSLDLDCLSPRCCCHHHLEDAGAHKRHQ